MKRRAAKDEGRPYQRNQDGRWVVAVRDLEGRRKYLYAWSPAEAIAKRDEHRAMVRMGLNPTPARLTVGRHLDDWLADRRGKVRPSTWVSYEGHVRLHLASLRAVPLTKLTPSDVRRLVREREAERCSAATISHTLVVLRMALRQAMADGLIHRNVAAFVKAPRTPRGELRILHPLEVRVLVDHDPDGLWTVLVGTGMRLGEALALRWSDVDLATGAVSIARSLRPIDKRLRGDGPRLQPVEPKTESGWRTLIVPSFVRDALRAHRERTKARPANRLGTVFATPKGTPLDPRNASRAWVAFCEEHELPVIRLHDLRHTAASLALSQGLTLEDVKRMLGHSTIAQTSDTYGHLVRERQNEVAASMDRAVFAANDAAQAAAGRAV